jgi:hypothetical protein
MAIAMERMIAATQQGDAVTSSGNSATLSFDDVISGGDASDAAARGGGWDGE